MVENPPWTEIPDSGRPSGIEVDLVEGGELGVVAAGLTETALWEKHAALTRPHTEIQTLDGRTGKTVPPVGLGENGFLTELERCLVQREERS